MQNRSKQEQSLQYTANGIDTKEMSRGGLIYFYLCRITGQLTCTAGNNTRANTLRGDALGVINRLRVRVNSQENVYDLDGAGIVGDSWYLLDALPHDTLAQLGDATTANPAFDTTFLIAFALPRRNVENPLDTALDARAGRMSKLEAEIQWFDHTAINPNATGFTVNPTITIESYKGFGAPDDLTPGYLRRYKLIDTLTATNPRELIRLPTTFSYQGFLLNSTDQSGSFESDVRTVFNRIKLISGSTIFEDRLPESLVQGFGRIWNGRTFEFGAVAGAGTQLTDFVPQQISTRFNLKGWYPLEVTYDGNLREMLDAAQLAEFNLEIDATKSANTCRINVYPYQYVVPPGRAVA